MKLCNYRPTFDQEPGEQVLQFYQLLNKCKNVKFLELNNIRFENDQDYEALKEKLEDDLDNAEDVDLNDPSHIGVPAMFVNYAGLCFKKVANSICDILVFYTSKQLI